MVAVGLHGDWLNGIDYIGETCKMVVYLYLIKILWELVSKVHVQQ